MVAVTGELKNALYEMIRPLAESIMTHDWPQISFFNDAKMLKTLGIDFFYAETYPSR